MSKKEKIIDLDITKLFKKTIMKRSIIIFCLLGLTPLQAFSYSNFYFGHCTWYVAKNKNVTWTGNAKDWYENAKAVGKETGYIPKEKAIVIFYGPGYSSKYGHVAMVEKVIGSNIIVSEMNYYYLGKKSMRIVSSTKSVLGYIY